jgi:DedD protein
LSTPFQNRLVGTIIVAAVAIIVLPDVLDGNKKTYQDEFEQIPSPPKVDLIKKTRSFPKDKIVKAKDNTLSDETALDEEMSLTQQQSKPEVEKGNSGIKVTPIVSPEEEISKAAVQKVIIETPKSNLPEKSVLKQAWVVQLGSFRHKKNVEQLLLKLKDNGYTAFTKPIKTKSGTLIKVIIGPELVKSSLEKKIPALKKLTGVQGKIARFYPAK